MSETALSSAISISRKARLETIRRLLRYTVVRVITLAVTVVIGVYLTILIANMGGYLDQIRRSEIREGVQARVLTDPTLRNLPPEARQKRVEDLIRLEEKRYGLDQPFILRSFRFLTNALTLNLGRSFQLTSDSGSRQVRLILLERLPATLLLFGASDMVLFFLALFLGLMLSRRYGSFWDKLTVALSPLSSAPGWFYGIFLIVVFAAVLKIFPFGGMVRIPPPENPLLYALDLLYHLVLPVSAITLSSIFLSVYSNRTFFLIYSSEDYVEMAKAKGLKDRDIERRYVLRPTLPTIITSFALLIIGLWTGAPIFETVFNWPGLGRTLFLAVGLFDVPVIVASTVIYAYLLAITVLLLDFIYAIVDPRVKIGGQERSA
uniref:Peptide/nickel transport system permease protein n=1 Tax=uncultured Chloroflexota bacterium TaxID=166587 RepID=H5SL44_9CHLR|nr:peptide/nickel transport system permease protein [uncultured Chloroflexota bacterium]BAL56880.1 peptide/nickel transport system permease protein [uncultured Chloroflexota bacterium]